MRELVCHWAFQLLYRHTSNFRIFSRTCACLSLASLRYRWYSVWESYFRPEFLNATLVLVWSVSSKLNFINWPYFRLLLYFLLFSLSHFPIKRGKEKRGLSVNEKKEVQVYTKSSETNFWLFWNGRQKASYLRKFIGRNEMKDLKRAWNWFVWDWWDTRFFSHSRADFAYPHISHGHIPRENICVQKSYKTWKMQKLRANAWSLQPKIWRWREFGS